MAELNKDTRLDIFLDKQDDWALMDTRQTNMPQFLIIEKKIKRWIIDLFVMSCPPPPPPPPPPSLSF